MKTVKKFRITNVTIFAVLFLCVAAAWALFANGAFATEATESNEAAEIPEATESNEATEANTLPNVTYFATPSNSLMQYVNIDQKMPLPEDQTLYSCSVTETSLSLRTNDFRLVFVVSVDTEAIKSTGYTFDGFYINGVKKTVPFTISSDRQIEVRFNSGNINAQVRSADGSPVQGFTLSLYDKDHNFIEAKTTDGSGKCTFENYDPIKFDYTVNGTKDGYTDIVAAFSKQMIDPFRKDISRNYTVNTIDNRNCIIQGKDKYHGYFNFTSSNILGGEVIEQASGFFKELNLWNYPNVVSEYTVMSDNSLREYSDYGTAQTETIFMAIPSEGGVFKSWIAEYDENGFHELKPGDTFTISWDTQKLSLEATYQDTPVPSPEEVNTTAQTGDSAPLVPFVLLTVLAGGVLVYSRKKVMKK